MAFANVSDIVMSVAVRMAVSVWAPGLKSLDGLKLGINISSVFRRQNPLRIQRYKPGQGPNY